MFKQQKASQILLNAGDPNPWITLATKDTLTDAVAGMQRIWAPTMGDRRVRNAEHYRIIETNTLGHIRKTFTKDGELVVDGSKQPSLANVA